MKDRPVQYFSDSQLEACRSLSPGEILTFIESFRMLLQNKDGKRKLISLRVPENLLEAFKARAKMEGKPYQTRLVELMRESLLNHLTNSPIPF